MPYGMSIHGVLQATGQATTQPSTAPAPPAIPALPARPGAATAGADATAPDVGGTAVILQPPPFGGPNQIPPEVIPLVGMTLGLLLAMVVLFPIARAIGRMIDRRTDKSLVRIAEVAPQLRQLQESVDAMAIELERISEAQRFTAKIMAEKPASAIGAGDRRA